MHRCGLLVVVAVVLPWVLGDPPGAEAGGGPDRVLVVVNADSPLSEIVANHYVRARGIHPLRICRVSGISSLTTIPVDEFRERILEPVLAHIDTHGLRNSVDVIAYSADFPFGVAFDSDFKDETLPQGVHKFRVGSLTGMTFLHGLVRKKDRGYLALDGSANPYLRFHGQEVRGARAFLRDLWWNPDGTCEPLGDRDPEEAPIRSGHLLATMLGASGIQGNTTDEILASLDRGVESDGTEPKGTVYLMVHPDIRAKTRLPFFDETERRCKTQKHRVRRLGPGTGKGAKGQDGKAPQGVKDIIGLVAGIASFTWSDDSAFLPGAIAEHLTSFGARLDGSGQTKCTEYIRRGATGTSGAVAEPYALWQKFPLPFLHAWYREGSSLSEAFYQSIANPYQLLVIGDPLARPYASLQSVVANVPDVASPWKDVVTFTPGLDARKGPDIAEYVLMVDGREAHSAPPGEPLELDTTVLAEGRHELRVVAVEDSPVGTRSRSDTVAFQVSQDGSGTGAWHRPPKGAVPFEKPLLLKARGAKGYAQAVLLHGTRTLAEAKVNGSGSFRFQVEPAAVGIGHHDLHVRLLRDDGPEAFGPPLVLDVEAPAPWKKGRGSPKGKTPGKKTGLLVTATLEDGSTVEVVVPTLAGRGKQTFLKALRSKAKGKITTLHVRGFVDAREGLTRFALRAEGVVTFTLDGHDVLRDVTVRPDALAFGLAPTQERWYAFDLSYEVQGTGDLEILWGGPDVTAPMAGKRLRH